MRFYQRPVAQLVAFVFLACWGIVGFYLIDRERDTRTRVFCAAEHQEQIDARRDEIEDFKDLERFAEFFNSPERLRVVAAARLRAKLQGRYGNNRIPSYCKQHDWPEDERQWPPELRSP